MTFASLYATWTNLLTYAQPHIHTQTLGKTKVLLSLISQMLWLYQSSLVIRLGPSSLEETFGQ